MPSGRYTRYRNSGAVNDSRTRADVPSGAAASSPGEPSRVPDAAGVPSGPVYTYAQLFADAQVRHLGMVTHADDPELGRVPHVRTPVRLSRSRIAVRSVAPRLGAHTTEILEALGYSPGEVDALRRERVI